MNDEQEDVPDHVLRMQQRSEERAASKKLLPHKRLYVFMKRLCDAYGWRFTAMACIIYGANGLGETFIRGAQDYYFFDIQGISAARFTQIEGFSRIPWEIKALYGMLSDTVSFWGMRRKPYLIFSGFVGAAAGFSLWTLPLEVTGAAGFLCLSQVGVAIADVMIDGSSGEKAHLRPDMASDLQAAMHCAAYFVGFCGDVAVGYLVEPNMLGSRGVFGLFIITAMSFAIPSKLGWLCEDPADEAPYDVGRMLGLYNAPKPPGRSAGKGGFAKVETNPMATLEVEEAEDDDANDAKDKKEKSTPAVAETREISAEEQAQIDLDLEIADRVRGPIFAGATVNSILSFILGIINLLYTGNNKVEVFGSLSMVFAVITPICLWKVLAPVHVDLAKAAIYIFLEGCFQPSTSIIFQWSHSDGDHHGNCSGNCDDDADDDDCGWARSRDYPCISPPFYGWAKALARIFGIVGVVLYSTYFAKWRYKPIFAFGHCVYFVANMLDLVWVTRTNLSLGINDELFLAGSEIIHPILRKLHTMPLLILSAKLCPKHVEATLFALMMAVWNFGYSMGKYNGVALLYMFGGVEAPQFKNLESFVFVRTLMFLGPLLLIPFFAPAGGPNDEETNYFKQHQGNSGAAQLDDIDKALKATRKTEIEMTARSTKKDTGKAVYAQVGQVSSIDAADDGENEAKESPTAELV